MGERCKMKVAQRETEDEHTFAGTDVPPTSYRAGMRSARLGLELFLASSDGKVKADEVEQLRGRGTGQDKLISFTDESRPRI